MLPAGPVITGVYVLNGWSLLFAHFATDYMSSDALVTLFQCFMVRLDTMAALTVLLALRYLSSGSAGTSWPSVQYCGSIMCSIASLSDVMWDLKCVEGSIQKMESLMILLRTSMRIVPESA